MLKLYNKLYYNLLQLISRSCTRFLRCLDTDSHQFFVMEGGAQEGSLPQVFTGSGDISNTSLPP